jgi:hypothetical protein
MLIRMKPEGFAVEESASPRVFHGEERLWRNLIEMSEFIKK